MPGSSFGTAGVGGAVLVGADEDDDAADDEPDDEPLACLSADDPQPATRSSATAAVATTVVLDLIDTPLRSSAPDRCRSSQHGRHPLCTEPAANGRGGAPQVASIG
jgi:hypothetical protein